MIVNALDLASLPAVVPIARHGFATQGSAGTNPSSGMAGHTSGAAQTSFQTLLAQGLAEVNTSLVQAQVQTQRLAAGEPVALHQVMLQIEDARLQFQLMLQVRNRLLESYQEIMRMQV